MPTLTPSQLQFVSAIATLPTLFVAPSVDPEALALIKEILEEFYFDGIDDIVSAELDGGGDIVGEFTDRVGARSVKRYRYKITDDEVSYGLLNSKEVATFAVFAPMFGTGSRKGKKKTCSKGTPCGDACIQASRMCRKKAGSAVKAKIVEAKEVLGGKAKTTKAGSPPTGSAKAFGSVPKETVTTFGKAILALPPAGQSSAPENKRNGPPLKPQEVKAAIYKHFGVANSKELKESAKFHMATNGTIPDLRNNEAWKQVYRKWVGVLPDERFETGKNAINGVDILKYARPWQVFGVDPQSPKYADTKGLKGKEKKADHEAKQNLLVEDVKKAYKGLATKYHPDVGGDPVLFQRLTQFKDSLTHRF